MVTAELPELIQQDMGAPARSRAREYWWRCPFHDDSSPSFQVDYYERGAKWRWKCWGCERTGDALDWLVAYRGMTKGDAWRAVNGDAPAAPRPEVQPRQVSFSEPPAREWQDAALDTVLGCAAELRNPQNAQAAAALAWLHARGLHLATIERALLGWNPSWREVLPGHKLPPGIIIPAFADGTLWYVKARLPKREAARTGDKYLALAGSRTASLYGADGLLGACVAIATEGEFDALLLSQFVGSAELAVITMGSAGALPSPRWKSHLAWLDKLLVVMDTDDAGAKARERWQHVVQWVEAVNNPKAPGKDVTDWWRAGVDLRGWLEPYLLPLVPGYARAAELPTAPAQADAQDAPGAPNAGAGDTLDWLLATWDDARPGAGRHAWQNATA